MQISDLIALMLPYLRPPKTNELINSAREGIVDDVKSDALDSRLLSMVNNLLDDPAENEIYLDRRPSSYPVQSRVSYNTHVASPPCNAINRCSTMFAHRYGAVICDCLRSSLVQLRLITEFRTQITRILFTAINSSSDVDMGGILPTGTPPSSSCLIDWIVYEFLKEYCNVVSFIQRLTSATAESTYSQMLFSWLDSIRRVDQERRAGLCPAGCISSINRQKSISPERAYSAFSVLCSNTERVRTFTQTLVKLLPTVTAAAAAVAVSAPHHHHQQQQQ
ncbi:hypothetical protein ACOME3_007976 [Neoechinorhynchus agilis]